MAVWNKVWALEGDPFFIDCMIKDIQSELGKRHIPAHKRDIADVSGAGDTVIATAALCLAAGLDEFKASEIANLAGGLVCEHVGVVPINKTRLLEESRKL